MKKLIFILRPYSIFLIVIWILTIATISSIPHLPTPKVETGKVVIRLDYLIHFCEYGVLIFLALLSAAKKEFRLSFRKYIMITLAVIVFAVADELHQKLIPGRTFNIRDILSNIYGIIAGAAFCYIFFKRIAADVKTGAKPEDKISS
jgi:VanZ family protein